MTALYTIRDLKTSPAITAKMQQTSCQSATWRGRLFPSGRISVGRVPRKKIAKCDRNYEATRTRAVYGIKEHWDYQEGLVKEYYRRDYPPQTLGSSDVPICHKPKTRRYGLRGIGRRARNTILECATLLQTRYGRKLGFYTLTCPYTEETLVWEYNRCFAEIMRRFFQEVKRAYKRCGVAFKYIAVYEIQPTRFCETSTPVLHVHWLSPCYVPGTWDFVLDADEIRSIYLRVLSTVVSPNTYVSASLDAQVIRKSASGYLAKYLSKGGLEFGGTTDDGNSQVPGRWWSVSKSLLRAVAKFTIELSQDICQHLMYTPPSTLLECFCAYYCKPIYITWMQQELQVGVSMCVPAHVAKLIRPKGYVQAVHQEL